MTGETLKCDPYNGVCNSSMETVEYLYMLQGYCQTNAFKVKQALGVNSNIRYGYKLCNQLGSNQAADPFNQKLSLKTSVQVKIRSGSCNSQSESADLCTRGRF